MAEICFGETSPSSAVATGTCEASRRAARRRRMEIRRFKFVTGLEGEPPAVEELARKLRRQEVSGAPAVMVKDSGKGVIWCAGGGSTAGSSASASATPVERELPRAEDMDSGQSNRCHRYGMASVCGRRRDMEDAVSVRLNFLRRGSQFAGKYHFFGVYDGHGCSHVALTCRDRMHEMVEEEVAAMASSVAQHLPSPEEWMAAMERSFARMDAEVAAWCRLPRTPSCRCELQTPKCGHVGSTAVVAVVGPDLIVVANCGDSRAVLCRDGLPVPLSTDHKPDRPDELRRIESVGGRVIYWDGARVLGVLAMSRAIGDRYLKPYVISEPEVTVSERTEGDECLILASDGLWDVVTNETACEVVRMCLRSATPGPPSPAAGPGSGTGIGAGEWQRRSDKACADAAMLLTKLALARQSADNVSVVVVDLRRSS